MRHHAHAATAHPVAELRVGSILRREIEQTAQVEIVTNDARSAAARVVGVAVLLYVCRHHEYRLAQIHGLAHRLEPGGCGVGATSGERLEEGFVVYLIEREVAVHLINLAHALLVPEEVERHVGVIAVPAVDALAETGVHHVAVQIVAGHRLGVEHVATKQRRHHAHARFTVVGHVSERQGELVLRSDAGDACEHAQEEQTHGAALRKLETIVQEQILMAYAHLRHLRTEQQIGQSGEQFIEIDYEVGLRLFYPAADEKNALQVSWYLEDVICHAAREVAALV